MPAKLEGALAAEAAVPPAKGLGPKLAAVLKLEGALGAEAAVPLVNEAAALKVALVPVAALKSAAGALKVDGALKLEGALAAEAGAPEL